MMSGINSSGVHDTAAVAIANGQQFINDQLKLSGQVNGVNLGNAAHAIGDKYSDSHGGEDWDGFKELGFLGTAKHVIKDTFPSMSNIKGAYNETKALIEAAMGNKPSSYLNSQYNTNNVGAQSQDGGK